MDAELRGVKFNFHDSVDIQAMVAEIFADNYHVLASGLQFSPGDVVVDLGANEGVFSIMMAKLFPGVKVVAVEPVPRTYAQLVANISANDLTGAISPHNLGVGKSPGRVTFNVSRDHSGGSTGICTFVEKDMVQVEADVLPLAQILAPYPKIKLLKVDIEGMEYEALYAFKDWFRIENLVMEVHMNRKLEYVGRRVDGLINWVSNRTKLIHADVCQMCE